MNRPDTVIIGARASALSLAQVEIVKKRLGAAFPAGLSIEFVPITTEGDRISRGLSASAETTGLFTKELEKALLEDRIDIAVHSLKDLPTRLPDGLALCAILPRADVRDALISRDGRSFADLAAGARIGTSSPRRMAQIRRLRPDLEIVPLRGNVDTRIRKLHSVPLDAVLMAAAGLERLGRKAEATELLDPSRFLPAPGQAAIAVECRAGDGAAFRLVQCLDDPSTRAEVAAERSLLHHLEGGCRVPVGALARMGRDGLALSAAAFSLDGSRAVAGTLTGAPEEAEALGERLAARLLASGADAILKEIRECQRPLGASE